MLKHIGAGYLVKERDIVGYFDIDGHEDSEITRDFLKNASKNGRCDTAGEDLPRSFVLTSPESDKAKKKKQTYGKKDTDTEINSHRNDKVILTHISTQALRKR